MNKPYEFDVITATNACINWIKDWFKTNGPECKAVVGISGGKDSSVCAALCCKALGKERVIGVLMPQGEQFDIDYSYLLCNHLEIKYFVIDISQGVNAIKSSIEKVIEVSKQTNLNLPARVRMTSLYALSQSVNGRVVNTCNLSEDYIGYSTKYGDAAGDFSPISKFTVNEVKQIGAYLGLPDVLVNKTPLDGLCGKSDEENLGFSYDQLDKYIRLGILPPEEIKKKIDHLHIINKFKLEPIPYFPYQNNITEDK